MRVEVDVRDDQIERAPRHQRHRRGRIVRGLDLAIRLRQQLGHERARLAVVVDDQDVGHGSVSVGRQRGAAGCAAAVTSVSAAGAACAGGRSTVKTAPPAARFDTVIVPPCAPITPRAIARPRPVPRPNGLVVTHGSKIVWHQAVRHAGPAVAHLEADAVAEPRQREGERAAFDHRVDRVGHQVQQRELELHGVGLDPRQAGLGVDLHRDVIAIEPRLGDLEHAIDQRGGLDLDALHRAPRAIQQAADRAGDLLDLALHHLEPPAGPGVERRRPASSICT